MTAKNFPKEKSMKLRSEKADICASPDPEAEVIRTLNKDDEFYLLGEIENYDLKWDEVRLQDGSTGYIGETIEAEEIAGNKSKIDKHKIGSTAGFIGGGVFFVLNITSNGAVPGGFKGGVLGFIVGYGLSFLVLSIFESLSGAKKPAIQHGKNNPEKESAAQGLRSSKQETKAKQNWYSAKQGSVEQVVIEIKPNAKESRFGTLMFAAKYLHLAQHPLTVGFFALDSKPDPPYLMIRTDNLVGEMAKSPIRIAFSFCKMPSGGVLAIFVESPVMKKHLRNSFLEEVLGLDYEDQKQRIRNAFKKDKLDIVLADGHGGTATIDGSFASVDPIYAEYDIVFPMQKDLRDLLGKKFEDLLSYHHSLRSRDYNKSANELWRMIPENKSPIINAPG